MLDLMNDLSKMMNQQKANTFMSASRPELTIYFNKLKKSSMIINAIKN